MENVLKGVLLSSILVFGLSACGGSGSDSGTQDPVQVQNSSPVSNAGTDQNIATGSVVTLNGAASSDADGDTLSYQWSLTSVPSGSAVALSNATGASPTFTADTDGSYIAQLIVNDGTENSAPDTVTIVASTANSAPVANAGTDQNIATGSVVTLNGTASSDADGDTLSYQWSLTSVPSGSAAALSNATGASPTFTADTDG
ncbi:PKD domain-containing protein, partial [Teredinibacter turnerae]|uniref:PKD domain-containing protein n=1 Tax=Teredinibacter turnerae TaxID=2426 RepID=UPI00056FF90E